MTEEQTSTSSAEASHAEPTATDAGTTTAETPDPGQGSTQDSGASSSGASSGKKSWRGRARAAKPDRSAKAGGAAATDEAAEADRTEEAGGDADQDETQTKQKKQRKTRQPKQKREKQVAEKKRRTPGHGMGVGEIRTLVARIVWVVCLVFALLLALTALFIALKANADNDAVRFIVDAADKVDLGVFDLRNPIKDFDTGEGPSTDTKTALFNYGIGAVVWLIIGRIGDRVIRP